MNLTAKESDIVFGIMSDLSYGHNSGELRLNVGRKLLELLNADYFASYVWNLGDRRFQSRVSINMSDRNLASYDSYFQFCDPITPLLQRCRKATCVTEIMPRRRLERTEFFNDFLARDGLYYGVNYYAYSVNRNIGDLRIWRGRAKEDFTRRDLEILDAVGPSFTSAMRRALVEESEAAGCLDLAPAIDKMASDAGLTDREVEICTSALQGMSDREIASHFGISPATVRTHLKHVYEKTGISGRQQILGKLLRH